MSIIGIQGFPLELTVTGCFNLENKEWISRQDPYVGIEYGNNKFRTKTCQDGGKNPIFQEKFILTLVEGLREVNAVVWNSHSLSADEYIGTARIQLHKALSQGYDDSSWPLLNQFGRHAGEVRIILHYSNAMGGRAMYTTPYPPSLYPPQPSGYPPATSLYPPQSLGYPPATSLYPPQPLGYPPATSQYPPQPLGYPPTNSQYPPQPLGYPPTTSQYPPQPQAYYPPGPLPGVYPPPPSY